MRRESDETGSVSHIYYSLKRHINPKHLPLLPLHLAEQEQGFLHPDQSGGGEVEVSRFNFLVGGVFSQKVIICVCNVRVRGRYKYKILCHVLDKLG